jgi:hypothetical protein
MTEDGPTEQPPHTDDITDRARPTESAEDVESPVWRVLLGIPRGREHDLRVIEQLSLASFFDLRLSLHQLRNSKYELLQRYTDLERLRDVHPRRGALTKLERRIQLFEQAIRSKELVATQALGASEEGLPEAASPCADRRDAIPTRMRRHGPRPDIDSHRKVAEVVDRLGPQWKDDPELLCQSLDDAKVSVSKAWLKKRRESWNEAFLDTTAENIIKAVLYRLKKAEKASWHNVE